TVEFWRRWLSQSRYRGRWRETVHRSALVLKLLTYQPTGAMVAAPTTSLPVQLGGGRNWDYRYTWIRDTAFSLYALLRLGFTDETPISHGAWSDLARIVEWVCENWDQADEGIWEVRGGRQHFTYSRLMSWVAVERAIRIARQRGLPADLPRWLAIRDQIYHQVMTRGFHAGRGA